MKAFTLFNIIAQPVLILLMLVFSWSNYLIFIGILFPVFCGLQITHFWYRIQPKYRKQKALTVSEEMMRVYLIVILGLLVLSIFSYATFSALLGLLLTTCIFSSIGNYIHTVKYYQFINDIDNEIL